MKIADLKKLKKEKHVQSEVLNFLNSMPNVCRVWRANTGAAIFCGKDGKASFVRFGFRGMSDVQGYMCDGKALFIEVKAPGKKPTSLQEAFINNAEKFGCVAFYADSLDTVVKKFRERGYLK